MGYLYTKKPNRDGHKNPSRHAQLRVPPVRDGTIKLSDAKPGLTVTVSFPETVQGD
jgi:hypothetical protein